MDGTVALVSSVTHAIKGRRALERYGIHSSMERNKNYGDSDGCAYILKIRTDPATAKEIFMREGVKVKRITEGGRTP